jgi:uncharacterized protein YndB with AHSA1/START domain
MRALAVAALLALALPAAAAGERALRKEALIAAPVEAVWKAWTTSEGIATFFAPEAVVEARPDGAFSIHIDPYAKPGMRGADDMRVLGVQENRMLSFTWNAPPHLPEARAQRTVVIVRLAPEDGGTRVTLTHLGWGDGGQWDDAYKYFDRAWGNVLANLGKRFAEGPIDWTEWRAQLRAMHEKQKK